MSERESKRVRKIERVRKKEREIEKENHSDENEDRFGQNDKKAKKKPKTENFVPAPNPECPIGYNHSAEFCDRVPA